jgi:hypothetical protein
LGFRNKICKYDSSFKCITLVDCSKCEKEDYLWAIKWKEHIWKETPDFPDSKTDLVEEVDNAARK